MAMPSSELYSQIDERHVPTHVDVLSSLECRRAISLAARSNVEEPFAFGRATARDRDRLGEWRPTESERRLRMRVDSLSACESQRTVGMSARKAVEERFTWSRAVAETIAVYREVLRRP